VWAYPRGASGRTPVRDPRRRGAGVTEPVTFRHPRCTGSREQVRFAEGLVRGQDDRALLVTLGGRLQDRVRLGAFEGLVADLVDHEDAGPQVGPEFAGQTACCLGRFEVADHVVEAGEVDRVAGPAGCDGQGDGDVGLADCGRAEQGDGRLVLDEGEGGEVLDLARVEVGLEGEVVVVQRLVVRQPRQPQALTEAAVVLHREFLGQHPVEEREVAHLCLVSPLDVLVQGLGQVRQAELDGRGADAGAGRLAQRDSFVGELGVKGRVPVSSS
jgi:hypothetical protein